MSGSGQPKTSKHGSPLDGECRPGALQQTGPKDRVAQVGLTLRDALDGVL